MSMDEGKAQEVPPYLRNYCQLMVARREKSVFFRMQTWEEDLTPTHRQKSLKGLSGIFWKRERDDESEHIKLGGESGGRDGGGIWGEGMEVDLIRTQYMLVWMLNEILKRNVWESQSYWVKKLE